MLFDLKVIGSVLSQLEEERGIPRQKVVEAIEMALATAYKKEYGKKGQIVRASFVPETGDTTFYQVKVAVDDDKVAYRNEDGTISDEVREKTEDEDSEIVLFNPEQHILLSDAKKMKKDIEPGEEITFELEEKGDYGRIASQTAKQVIIQKVREAEKSSVLDEYGKQESEIVSGTVQRVERGNMFVDLGRATGLLPREEQIPGERFRQGERIRAYLVNVEESSKGVFVKLSRSHPKFLQKLFESETPELGSGAVEIKRIAREPGSRSKVAAVAHDEHIDPVGAMVGQRGVRVSTVMSELGGEKIDIIEWSEDPIQFIEDALSPAQVLDVEVDEEERRATVEVTEDQQSLAIGKAGQNVRLAAKLTGYKIDIRSTKGENVAEADSEGVEIFENEQELAEDAEETKDDPSDKKDEEENTAEAGQTDESLDDEPESSGGSREEEAQKDEENAREGKKENSNKEDEEIEEDDEGTEEDEKNDTEVAKDEEEGK